MFMDGLGFRLGCFHAGFRHCIAEIRVLVFRHFRQRTNQRSCCIIAMLFMGMDHVLRIAADHKALFILAFRSVNMGLRSAFQNVRPDSVAGIIMLVDFFSAGRLFLLCNGRQDQCVGGAEDHHSSHGRYDSLPYLSASAANGITTHFMRLFFVHGPITYLSRLISQSSIPAAFSGQTRKTIFPTICSSAIQPMAVLRESTDVARWSPITKMRFSGT